MGMSIDGVEVRYFNDSDKLHKSSVVILLKGHALDSELIEKIRHLIEQANPVDYSEYWIGKFSDSVTV